jgi:hypothetical protein
MSLEDIKIEGKMRRYKHTSLKERWKFQDSNKEVHSEESLEQSLSSDTTTLLTTDGH